MYSAEIDQLTSVVSRVLRVEDVTYGDSKKQYVARYRGRLHNEDTAQAYEQLSTALRPYEITPLFRKEKDQHVVILLSGIVRPKPSNAWVNLVLFILTVLSVLIAGVYYTLGGTYDGPSNPSFQQLLPYVLKSLGGGVAFATSILAILLAHVFGHYLAGRYHRTHVTLPYFIPFPFSAFGTMGAFIQLKEPPKNKRILLDIGIAGPLAGLVVAIPVLILGLGLSELNSIPSQLVSGQGLQIEGNSILYLLSKYVVFGQLLPSPSSYGGLPVWQYWLQYFFTGRPLPLGGVDVFLHPVAWAGWAGLLVTALNLIPAGQLDGGHVMYVLLGRRVTTLLPIILIALLALGLVWPGWWLWALLIFLLGRLHAEPLDQITPLDPPRRMVAVLGLVIFVLVFTPVPLLAVGL
ncbi:MAG: site-2 protease family protein [Anaerolineales bacterium]|nr:MAG: site-2 protease family protein [Anaerolineales bacterium]